MLHVSEDCVPREIVTQVETWADFWDHASANVLASESGDILACNEAFLSLFGYSSIEAATQGNLFSILGGEAREGIEARLKTNRTVLGLSVSVQRNGGQDLRLATSWSSESVPLCGMNLLRATLAEVGRGGSREEELRWQLSRMLVSALAHELNNATAPILLFLSVLRKKLNDSEDVALLDSLGSSVRSAAGSVKQLILFTLCGEGEQQEMNLRTLVRVTLRSLRKEARNAIEVEEVLPAELGAVIGDPGEISLALFLLGSAILRNCRAGGRLIVRSGVAYLEKDHPRLGQFFVIEFEFDYDSRERASDCGKRETGRQALEISAAEAVIEAQNGFLETIHTGSAGKKSVKAYFRAAPRGGALSPVSRAGKPAPDPRVVLVVDDEVTIRQVAKKVLESHDMTVLTADSGPAALTLLQRHDLRIDLLLTDLSMPDMGGAELIREGRRRRGDLRVIAMSGSLEEAEALERSGVDVQAYLDKPFDAETLLGALRGSARKV